MKTHTLAALALAASALTSPALAHATLEQTQATPGATTKITLRVPHGCGDLATHTVRMTLPEGFYNAKPMPKAGWTLTTTTGAYARPFLNHGTEMTQGLREVVWSGGTLENGWYDEFTVRGTVGPEMTPGEVMYFPAEQLCDGATADWTDTSGTAGVPNPAPKLTLVAGDAPMGHAHGHGHDDKAAAMVPHGDAVTLGALTLSGGFSRATLPNAPVGGGFLTIANAGPEDDRLIAVDSPAAGYMEIHEMAMDGEVMRMRELPEGLPIPAGETVELKPGGYHLMLMQLNGPLVEGETVPLSLTFEKAGTVEMSLHIGAPNARTPGGHQMAH